MLGGSTGTALPRRAGPNGPDRALPRFGAGAGGSIYGLILAAGEGSRLAADGIEAAKALVPIDGVPQLVRVARTLRDLGCAPTVCVLREDLAPRLPALFAAHDAPASLECVPVRTPSSLHSLVCGLRVLPRGPVLCAMVDTAMRPSDWERLHEGFVRALADGADAALAVTPDTGGEAALYAVVEPAGGVFALRDGPPAPLVTGGAYAFADSARTLALEAVDSGLHRMRAFLRRLLEAGRRVDAVTIDRIIDLDRRSNLEEAVRLLRAPSPH